MIVGFDPEAREELFRGSDFYEERRAGYGLKFVWAVEQAVLRTVEMPHAASRWPDTPAEPAIRRRKVPGFPAVYLAYAALVDRIYVLAVVHAKRQPGYWFTRIDNLKR